MNQFTSTSGLKGQPAELQPLQARPDQRSDAVASSDRTPSDKTPSGPNMPGLGRGQTSGSSVGPSSGPTSGTSSRPPSGANLSSDRGAERPAVAPVAGLSEADVKLLLRGLLAGETALARRSDMVELYTRVVKLFETLNTGVGEMYVAKAETDRGMLSARIDGLEDAVNRMEGALRIEFEPVLRQTISQVMADQAGQKPKRRSGLWMAGILVAGLSLGAVFHAPLSGAAAATVSKAETIVSTFMAKLYPNGGSS